MDRNELNQQIEHYQNIFCQRVERWQRLVNMLPDGLVEKAKINWLSDEVEIILPYSMQALTEARRQLGAGWKRVMTWGRNEPDHTFKCITYRHTKTQLEVRLVLEMNRPGSTCRRVKVDEKIVEVFEVVCI